MKKYIFLTIALISFTFSKAQEIKGGIRGGLNYSLITEDVKDDKGNLGFELGYFESLTFKNNCKLQAEINYVKNSFKNSEAKISYTYNYIEVPVLVKFPVASNFDLGAGLKYAFALNGKSKIDAEESYEEELGTNGGFGLLLEGVYTKDKMNLGLRVNYGGGEVINGYTRTSANLFVAYSLF